MPAFDAAATIVESVSSALAQTIPEIEVIVVDDGSAQPVAEVLSTVRDERLRVFRTARNRGVSAARNSALAAARAPLVAQLDADDLWRERHLEGLLPAFIDPGVGLAYSNADVIGHPEGRDRWIGELTSPEDQARSVTGSQVHPVNELAALYRGNAIPAPGVLLRTGAVRAVGGYPQWLKVGEDYLLYLRLRRAGWRFAYVDRRSAIYRWPQPGRGATFDRRRHARQGVKLFAALALASPWERELRIRLAYELAEVVSTHVPGSIPLWRLCRRAWFRARSA